MKRIIMLFILLAFVGCSTVPAKTDYKAVQLKMIDYETAKSKYELFKHQNETVDELTAENKYADELITASKELIEVIEDYKKAVAE